MRSGNRSQKRRPKGLFRRPKASKMGKERILLVCEDEKTEPNYLKELCGVLGLTSADVVVCGRECGSDPKSILDYALELYEQDRGIDWVYCVFDKDCHPSYEDTVKRIENNKLDKGSNLKVIRSVPCFEYWVLLHFKETTKPYVKGRRNPCDALIKDLKIDFPEYSKAMRGLYAQIGDKTNIAVSNAKRTMKAAQKTGTDNPTTEMHLLIEHLCKLAED